MSIANDVEVAAAMLAEYAGSWQVTEDRVAVLERGGARLPGHLRVAAVEMADSGRKGAARWEATTERYRVVRALISSAGRPALGEPRTVLDQMLAGAEEDGVLDRAWVQSAVDLLRRLAD